MFQSYYAPQEDCNSSLVLLGGVCLGTLSKLLLEHLLVYQTKSINNLVWMKLDLISLI